MYPNAKCALIHKNPLQLLIATILSAQCTDKIINTITPKLFKKYPDAKSFAEADTNELEKMIHSAGFYRNKSQNIIKCCKVLVEKYNGEIPKTIEELIKLSGIGRKTANVVLGTAFNIASGIAVDTHVKRLSQRLGLTKEKTPEKIELDLMNIIPKDEWIMFSHRLIRHGRLICNSRKPKCNECKLNDLCPSAYQFKHFKEENDYV